MLLLEFTVIYHYFMFAFNHDLKKNLIFGYFAKQYFEMSDTFMLLLFSL